MKTFDELFKMFVESKDSEIKKEVDNASCEDIRCFFKENKLEFHSKKRAFEDIKLYLNIVKIIGNIKVK